MRGELFRRENIFTKLTFCALSARASPIPMPEYPTFPNLTIIRILCTVLVRSLRNIVRMNELNINCLPLEEIFLIQRIFTILNISSTHNYSLTGVRAPRFEWPGGVSKVSVGRGPSPSAPIPVWIGDAHNAVQLSRCGFVNLWITSIGLSPSCFRFRFAIDRGSIQWNGSSH